MLGYVVVEFADKDGPPAVWLEFGHAQDGARLVNYIVSRDEFPRMKGKPLPKGGIRVQSFQMPHPENGWFDFYSQIDNVPDEMPGLQNANLELRYGPVEAADQESRETTYERVREFARRFEARNGTAVCRDLIKCDIDTPEGLATAREQ